MAAALEILGLLALVVMGFLLAPWVGFGVTGVACLVVSWAITRRQRETVKRRRPDGRVVA